tara:strand:- start:832 stop:1152 length:321 start_codon:yes stop_codon:yes gene_type:complete
MCVPAVEKPAKKLLKGVSKVPEKIYKEAIKVPKKAVEEVGKAVGLIDSKPDVIQVPAPTPEPIEPVEQMGAAGGGVLTTAPRGKGVGRRTSFGARASLINLRNFDS